MRVRKAILILLGGFLFFCSKTYAGDPKLFHFAYTSQFLLDDATDENTWEKTNASPSVANFGNFIYIAWKGLDKRVNLCMVGRTDYLDFADSLKTSKKKIILDDSTNNAPALVVVDNRLVLLYIQKGSNLLEYRVIDTAGSIVYKTGSPIDMRPYLPPTGGIFDGISACKYTDSTFVGAVTTTSTQNRKIQAFTFRLNNRDKLFINNVFQLPEESNYMPSVCFLDDNLVGFGIITRPGNPRFFAYHVDKDSIGANYTYTGGGSNNAPFIYKKENEEDIHLLWKGISGDAAIYEAAFTEEEVEFVQFKLTDDINNMYSGYAPVVFPMNDFYYGIVWVGTDKNQFWMSKALAYNYESWMGDLLNEELTLKEIIIPGAESALMNYEESDEADISFTDLIDKNLNQCSDCNSAFQHADVQGLLESGIRYMESDLVYTRNSFFDDFKLSDYILNVNVQSGVVYPGLCQGSEFEEAIEAIADFLEENPEEFVIYNIRSFLGLSAREMAEEVLNKYANKLEFYTASNGNNTYNDLFNVPYKLLKGKLIITTEDEAFAERFGFFLNIFNRIDDAYNARTAYIYADINKMFQSQEDFIQKGAEYKRIDWHVNNTAIRALCNFKTFEECVEAYKEWKDLINKKKFSWHLIFSTIACGKELAEIPEAFEELSHGDFMPLFYQIMGVLAWLNENAAYENINKTNLEIPAYFQKWRNEGLLNKNNRYNILFTEFSQPWISDIAIMDNVYFNTLDLVTPYNRIIDVNIKNNLEDCSNQYNATIEVEVKGDNGPYIFEWLHTNSSSPIQSQLAEGTYEVKVTDKWGHSVVKRIHLKANDDIFNQLAGSNQSVTHFQPKHGNKLYAANCSELLANIKSDHSASAWQDSTTVKVFKEATSLKNMVSRHFDIQSKKPGGANITLFFTKEEILLFNQNHPTFPLPLSNDDENRKNVLLIHQEGNSASGQYNSYSGNTYKIYPEPTSIIWDDINQRLEITFHVKSGGGFFLSADDGSKNNGFINVNAYTVGSYNYIGWKALEKNVLSYYVEYSYDKENFISLGRMLSKGSGTNDYDYRHTDILLPPAQQVIFYRVRQISKTGKTIFSDTVAVNMSGRSPLLVFPNPASDFIQIASNRDCTIYISDMSGRKMLVQEILAGNHQLDIRGWNKGLYILRTNDGETFKILVH